MDVNTKSGPHPSLQSGSGEVREANPRALDLFCGAGGATKGLQLAGFHVTGVDIKPQPRYCGDEFHQADALTFPLEGFDFIWASPPCQAFTKLRFMSTAKQHPNLIPETRGRLIASGIPYAIENVEDAPLGGEQGNLILLCGTMFGLRTPDCRAEIWRHRLFETSFSIPLRPRCQHRFDSRMVLTAVGHTPVDNTYRRRKIRAMSVTGATPQTNVVNNVVRETFTVDEARFAMGIDWMPMKSLSQAIPPAYSEFIGQQVMEHLQPDAAQRNSVRGDVADGDGDAKTGCADDRDFGEFDAGDLAEAMEEFWVTRRMPRPDATRTDSVCNDVEPQDVAEGKQE